VIPTFAAQIAAGGPVTVTDPRMTRYFMSIHEAVQLVLQAAVLAAGGEVFMLDMGHPVNILDLAERMIRLSGRVVGTDVPIRIVGRRPGEKLHEDLRAPDERSTPTAHPSILRVLGPAFDPGRLKRGIDDLERLVALGAEDDATQLLGDLANRQAVLDRWHDECGVPPMSPRNEAEQTGR
jgi:FlaA1/EpsC-like NDP-sugar epimerase